MSFILDVLRDKPVGLFLMDDTSPVQDYSSFARTATISGGTPVQHAALVKGAAWAPVFTSAITCAFPNVVFLKGFENVPFTLSAAVRVVDSAGNGEQQILGNSGQLDGLTINGGVVSFVTKFTTTGEARASYDLQQDQEALVYGVHTESKNSLFVNGLLVAEAIITDVQQADTYASTSANLICGTTSGSQKIAVNGVAYYTAPLTGEVIARQFKTSRDLPTPEENVSSNAGNYIELGVNNTNFFIDKWFSTTDDWNSGVFDNVAVIDDVLVPSFTDDTSVAGHWYNSVNLEQSGVVSIYGVNVNWDGVGATVEVSLDGTTWEAAVRGKNLTTVPAGFNPTSQVLQIRIGFPGSILNDKSYVDNLNIVGLRTAVSTALAGRTVTYTGAYPKRDYPMTAWHDNWGVEIPAGGTVVISADTLTSLPARTIELAIKRQGVNPTLSMTGTTYQDGASATATLVDGQWTLMHVVAAADVTTAITINGPCIVGYVGIYDTALSAATIAAIYSDYVGTDAPRLPDTAIIAIAETAGNAKIYAHDWTISPTG